VRGGGGWKRKLPRPHDLAGCHSRSNTTTPHPSSSTPNVNHTLHRLRHPHDHHPSCPRFTARCAAYVFRAAGCRSAAEPANAHPPHRHHRNQQPSAARTGLLAPRGGGAAEATGPPRSSATVATHGRQQGREGGAACLASRVVPWGPAPATAWRRGLEEGALGLGIGVARSGATRDAGLSCFQYVSMI
jgi:hypothetical protein